eukprot:UN04346
MSIYNTNKDFFQNEENQKTAILHYNDTFFTTNADLEQICWGFAEQFRLKYPDVTIRPTLFLTTHEVDVNNVVAAEDGTVQNNVTALFYVYGPTDKEKHLLMQQKHLVQVLQQQLLQKVVVDQVLSKVRC